MELALATFAISDEVKAVARTFHELLILNIFIVSVVSLVKELLDFNFGAKLVD